ncbi:hypothetical protein RRG08_042307 [Elysia crispata]|uniref:Uncharacterized protein n=1 Tax=Elysia crispata TaxID=231223 RepID=A0AAE0ZWG1_9GAST|nr:hypothetical protein RRG08_042307 [Elysia crispata]
MSEGRAASPLESQQEIVIVVHDNQFPRTRLNGYLSYSLYIALCRVCRTTTGLGCPGIQLCSRVTLGAQSCSTVTLVTGLLELSPVAQ